MDRPKDTSSVFDEVPDERPSKNGSVRRDEHLSPAEIRQKIQDLTPAALSTLELQLQSEDEQVAQKAAVAILDRAGYGPKSTVMIGDATELEKLADDEAEQELLRFLAERTRRRQAGEKQVVH